MNAEAKSQGPGDTLIGLIGKKQVARILACSVRTVERLVALGALEKVMVLGAVRFRVKDVQKIVEEGTI